MNTHTAPLPLFKGVSLFEGSVSSPSPSLLLYLITSSATTSKSTTLLSWPGASPSFAVEWVSPPDYRRLVHFLWTCRCLLIHSWVSRLQEHTPQFPPSTSTQPRSKLTHTHPAFFSSFHVLLHFLIPGPRQVLFPWLCGCLKYIYTYTTVASYPPAQPFPRPRAGYHPAVVR